MTDKKPKHYVVELIGKGDSIDDPLRPPVDGDFVMATNPSHSLKDGLVLSKGKPVGGKEAKDKDFKQFKVKKDRLKMKERKK